MDQLMNHLSSAEFKIISYIIRCTIGFHKDSDTISISQFEEATGLARNTVLKGIKAMEENGYIKRNKSGISYTYSLSEKVNDSVKNESAGLIADPEAIQELNQLTVQQLNTQKNLKDNEENSSTIISSVSDALVDVLHITAYWISIFGEDKDLISGKLKDDVIKALENFGLEPLKKAILLRSMSEYYKKNKPELREKATAFFKYPETIKNDLNRFPKSLYSYDQMINQVTANASLTTDDYEKVEGVLGENGELYWKLK